MPRSLGIIVGVLTIPVAALIGLGGIAFVFDRSTAGRYLGPVVGLITIAAVVWLLSLSWRLISNRPRRTGGLLSPFALRLIGTVMVLLPVIALVSGALLTDGPERWWRPIQGCIYFLVGVRLFRLAARRSPEGLKDDSPSGV